jgi:hypothetical protein
MKIIKVNGCCDCPYYAFHGINKFICLLSEREVKDIKDSNPEWCELPDR